MLIQFINIQLRILAGYIGEPDVIHRMSTSEESSVSSINAANLKLPPFSSTEPIIWFRRAEIQFRLKGVKKSSLKSDYVLETLPDTVFKRISSWLNNEPNEVDYERLKSTLLKRFTTTPAERTQQILDMINDEHASRRGSQSPHESWEQLQSLLTLPQTDAITGKNMRIDLEKQLWLRTLPENIRSLLNDADDTPVEVLVKKADSLVLADKAAAIHSNGRGNRVNDIELQDKRIDYENERVNAVRPWRKDGFTHLSRKPAKGYITQAGICNYHDRYGSSARSCVEGCKWFAKNGMSGRRQ